MRIVILSLSFICKITENHKKIQNIKANRIFDIYSQYFIIVLLTDLQNLRKATKKDKNPQNIDKCI
jgi:hypothetical protein